MEIRDIDRHDVGQRRAFWEVGKASEDAYRPYDFWPAWESADVYYLEGRPGTELRLLAAYDGHTMIGTAQVAFPMLDNTHLAELSVRVHPDHQRRGIGRALLAAGEEAARTFGRRVVIGEAYSPLDEDGPGLRFALAAGYQQALEDGIKIVDLVETEPSWAALAAEVAPRMRDYTLVPWLDRVPDEHLDGYCRLGEAFNDEAPSGDLELEAEVWDEARVRGNEEQGRQIGRRVFAVGAVTTDGTLVGLTEAIVNDHLPTRGFQSGTLVFPEHRGHALGLAMKVANHQALRAAYPQCRILMTGNADVNAAMNAVNERLGYRDVERCVELQKDL